jgi:hypothetical protein
MTFAQSAADEFKKAPITVICTISGQVIALLALLVAWLQYTGSPASATTQSPAVAAPFHLGNLMLSLAFLLAMSLSLAVVIQLLARIHWFAALLLSVPTAVLAGFGTMVMLHLVPPRVLTASSSEFLTDVVFYGVAFIFIAINGMPVMRDLVKTDPNDQQEFGRTGNAVGALASHFYCSWSGRERSRLVLESWCKRSFFEPPFS